jgi:predicted Holliday junction resolvase-like endonuclease
MDLITILLFMIATALGIFIGHLLAKAAFNRRVPEIREDAISRSRAVLSGNFSEQLAPYLPDFKYSPSEARFIGKPIDFIVFKGADEKQIEEVIFIEVKSGQSKINAHERNLKAAIEAGRVRWEEYRIPQELTKRTVST